MKPKKNNDNDLPGTPPANEINAAADKSATGDAGMISLSDQLVDSAYVLSILPINERALQRLRSKGYISHIRIGHGRIMYRLQDVQELLNKHYKKAIR